MSERPRPTPAPTRERLVETTGRLLRRQGYSATGLNEIVARSGAPKGSLYFHFPGGKQELAQAAIEHSGAALREAIAVILARAATPAEGVGVLVDALAGGLGASRYRDGCPIATVTLELGEDAGPLRERADAVFASWLDALAAHLHEHGFDTAAAARRATLVLAAVEGALILARARRDLAPLRDVRDELVALCEAPR